MTDKMMLPQLGGGLFLADGGIETSLIFEAGWDLPYFAAFHLLKTPEGDATIRMYFRTYAEIARRHHVGLILESPTARASPDWAALLGYSSFELAQANQRAIDLLWEIREEYATASVPMVISGCVGPRRDGYAVAAAMSVEAAKTYHGEQVEALAEAGADQIGALTMSDAEEATGIALLAREAGLPVAISFTVEAEGRLPSGQSLPSAITQVDWESGGYPSYYMINCAHPAHFGHLLAGGQPWLDRLRGIRANASRKTHRQIMESCHLDRGNPAELAGQYAQLKRRLPSLNVMGGCCGTDHRHLEEIVRVCSPLFSAATDAR